MDDKTLLTRQLQFSIDEIIADNDMKADNVTKIKVIVQKYPDLLESLAWPHLQLALNKNDAKCRIMTIQIIDFLFQKSVKFRNLVMNDLNTVLSLVLGVQLSDSKALAQPPPGKWTKKLRMVGLIVLRDWQKKFTSLPQLGVALNWVKSKGGLEMPRDSDTIKSVLSESNQRPPGPSQAHLRTLQRFRRNVQEVEALIVDAEKQLDETNKVLAKLIPEDPLFTNDSPASPVKDVPAKTAEIANSYALGSSKYRLEIDLSETMGEIVKTHDNVELFDQLREKLTTLGQQFESLDGKSGWIKKIEGVKMKAMSESTPEDVTSQKRILKRLQEMHSKLKECIARGDIILEQDDFVEVEPKVPEIPQPEKVSDEEIENDPWSVNFGKRKRSASPDTLTARLLKEAPVVEFDQDLEHWDSQLVDGKKTNIPFNKTGLDYQHRFLGSTTEDHMLTETTMDVLGLRKRVRKVEIEMPEIPPCGAPIPNGGFCQRRDIKVCPVHGPIVPRDEYGLPMDLSNVDIFAPTTVVTRPLMASTDSKTTSIQRISRRMAKNTKKDLGPDPEAQMRERDRQINRW